MLAFAMTASPLTVVSAAAENTTITPSNNSGQLTITLKIKQDLTPTVKLDNWAYGSEANEPTVEGNLGNGAATYSYKAQGADDSTYTSNKPTAVGKYTVKADIAESDEYKSGSATADFEITPMTKGLTITLVIHEYGDIQYTWAQDNGKWKCTATKPCLDDHDFDVTETVTAASEVTTPALCEEKGVTTYTATFTNTEFEQQTKTETDVEKLGHTYGEPTYEWTQEGSEWKCTAKRTCGRVAAHTETETVTAENAVKTPAKCEEMGVTTYTATFTNTAFSQQTKDETDIDALDHNYGEPTYEWDFADGKWTCTAKRTCGRDAAHTETETVTATSVIAKDATCEDKGNTTYTATFENPVFTAQTKTVTDIEALGHRFLNFLKWVWDGFNHAIAWLTCDNNPEHVQTIDISSTVDTVDEPTCTEDGYNYYVATIDVAGKIYTTVNVETVDQLGHDWYPAYDWNFDGVSDGTTIPDYYLKVTLICNHDESHKLPLEVKMERIENEDGRVTFIGHCEYDGVDYTDSITVKQEPATPDVPTPDVPTPDVPTPDVPTPDEPTPVVPTPDEPTPVVPTPDEPTPVVPTPDEPEPAKEIKGILGDVNNDGQVDSADALLILRNSVGLETFDDTQKYLGDVNEDNENIDSSDALAVLRYSVGMIDIEKIGTPVSKTVA